MIEKLLTRLGYNNSEIEKAIGRPGSSMYKYIRNSSIQTGILIDLCYALKYNIFQDIANALPDEFTKTDKEAEQKLAFKMDNEKRIAELEEENKILKVQLEIVMRLKS
jgi:hypothetical protein